MIQDVPFDSDSYGAKLGWSRMRLLLVCAIPTTCPDIKTLVFSIRVSCTWPTVHDHSHHHFAAADMHMVGTNASPLSPLLYSTEYDENCAQFHLSFLVRFH
jgi:hypothetical protein